MPHQTHTCQTVVSRATLATPPGGSREAGPHRAAWQVICHAAQLLFPGHCWRRMAKQFKRFAGSIGMSTVLSVITLAHTNVPAAENGEYSCFVALRKNHTIQRSTKCTRCDCDTYFSAWHEVLFACTYCQLSGLWSKQFELFLTLACYQDTRLGTRITQFWSYLLPKTFPSLPT